MKTYRVKISNLGNQAEETTSYVAYSVRDCKDDTDRSAYAMAVRLQDVITMGKTIAEPLAQ
jgi:hypothetical protein